MTQEELDRLRAGATGRAGPLGAPVGEGLAARSIADYLRGGGGGQRIPRGGGGGLSYGGGNTAATPNWKALAAQRGAARDAGASVQELQAADAINRQTNEQNPFGYNKRQTKALENAWSSSPDKVALDAQNVQRAKQGLPPIQSSFGLNRYHTNADGSRDYNYSADGQYRGAIPEKFRNAPGNANTHDAHFNRETGQWEAGDLSLAQTFKDIGKGAMDAYGNIRNTIPLMGAEVVDGVKGLAGKFGGGNAISGGGADGVGNFGAIGDFFGGIGDNLGLTSYGDLAAKKAAAAPAAPLGNTFTPAAGSAGANPAAVAAATAKAQRETSNSSRRRSARTNATQAQKAKQATSHTSKAVKNFKSSKGKSAKAGVSGFNMGGPISAYNVGGIAQSNIKEEQIQQQQRAANAPQIASSGPGMGEQLAKKAIGSLLGSATGGLGSMLGGLFNDGGKIPHLNTGGPLSGNPNGYNEGGMMGETPIKKVMDEQKLEQQAKAFELEQKRKQEAHDAAMKQKAQAFSQGQKMKTASATTKMKPKSPLGG